METYTKIATIAIAILVLASAFACINLYGVMGPQNASERPTQSMPTRTPKATRRPTPKPTPTTVPSGPAGSFVEILEFDFEPSIWDDILVTGTIKNIHPSRNICRVSIRYKVLDREDNVIFTEGGAMSSDVLYPNATSPFRATLTTPEGWTKVRVSIEGAKYASDTAAC